MMLCSCWECRGSNCNLGLAEENAFRVLTNCKENGEEEPGIPYVTGVYAFHKDNAEVVEALCVLILELCQYGV